MLLNAIVTALGTPVQVRATAGSVTGTWGTGQNRTAGNVLVAVVSAGGSTASVAAFSTPANWTQVTVSSNNPAAGGTANAWTAVYTKTAAGGDAAPTFTATLAGTAAMTCTLLELQAASNAQQESGYGFPSDFTGSYSSGVAAGTLSASTVAAQTGRVTSAPGDYVVTVFCQEAAAGTNTWNGGGGWSNLVNDGATSSVLHTAVDAQSNVAVSTASTETGHWTTNTTAFGAASIIAFAPQTGAIEMFSNTGSTTISSGGTTAPAAGTPEIWTAASWASFPAASNTAQPPVMFKVADTVANSETIAVLNTATGLVIRGADGTTPVPHAAGFTIQNVVSSGYLISSLRQEFVVPPATGVAATDSANIRGALSAAWSAGSGRVRLQPGIYVGDANQFYVPPSVALILSQGTQLQVNCTAAADAVSVDEGGSIVGEGRAAALPSTNGNIVDTGTVNCRALIGNTLKGAAGGQEFFYLEGLHIQATSGTYSVAVLDMDTCFTNSGCKDLLITGSGTTTVPQVNVSNGGPLWFRNCWFHTCHGDLMYVSHGTGGLWLDDCELDHPGAGFHHLNLDGTAATIYNVRLCGFHTENNTVVSSGTTAMIRANVVHALTVLDWALYCGVAVANHVGLWIANADNQQIYIKNVKNVNGVSPVIQDDIAGTTMALGSNVYEYRGPGANNSSPGIYGQLRFAQGDLRFAAQSVALASTAVDASFGNIVDVAALAAGVTVANPTNPRANQMLIYKFVQNGTGGFAVTWGGAFRAAAGVVSTTASKASIVAFRYDSGLSAWIQMWATTGVLGTIQEVAYNVGLYANPG